MAAIDVDEFRRWRAQADSALAAARATQAAQPAWACFLAEQAAQLAVKGLLHAAGLGAWGHDLVALEARLREPLGAAWTDRSAEAARLARHYVPTRYPDAHPGGVPAERYGADDARGALADAEAILAAVDAAVRTLEAAP
jgi:HEPN domain-containing protein